jgi:hypothetical protein
MPGPEFLRLGAPTSYDNIERSPHYSRDPPCDPCNQRRNCPRFRRRSSGWRHSCRCGQPPQGSARRSDTTNRPWPAPTRPIASIHALTCSEERLISYLWALGHFGSLDELVDSWSIKRNAIYNTPADIRILSRTSHTTHYIDFNRRELIVVYVHLVCLRIMHGKTKYLRPREIVRGALFHTY